MRHWGPQVYRPGAGESQQKDRGPANRLARAANGLADAKFAFKPRRSHLYFPLLRAAPNHNGLPREYRTESTVVLIEFGIPVLLCNQE
jgi:hypothetical protein